MDKKEKEVLEKMQDTRLYKWTARLPPTVKFEDSGEKIPTRVLDSLFEKGFIDVDDADAFETWFTLTDHGKKALQSAK